MARPKGITAGETRPYIPQRKGGRRSPVVVLNVGALMPDAPADGPLPTVGATAVADETGRVVEFRLRLAEAAS